MRTWQLVAIIAAGLVVALIWAGAREEGVAVPNGALADLQGAAVRLEDFRGKVVLLDFWASWCAPCRQAMPHTEAFSASPAAKAGELVVLAVNVNETKAEAERFITAHHYTLRVLLDGQGRLADAFQVRGLPTFVVLGRDGKVRYRQSGLDEPGLDAAVRAALAAP
ncbi:MAG TPA: TlpA disulfide reductase family protein [Armatimonadota bacterium]|nr:TlpA disulfide reductase family protein [Armatimonadota bacterium]